MVRTRRAAASVGSLLVVLVMGGAGVEAQAPLRVLPPIGTTVRASVEANPRSRTSKGELVSGSDLHIVLRPVKGALDTIPRPSILRLDVSAGRSHTIGALKGLGIGAAVGAVVVGLIGSSSGSSPSPCDGPGCGGGFVFGAVVGASIGAPAGALLGLGIGSQRWERVW